MIIAIIHTEIRQITLGGQESVEKAIKNLQDAVYTLSQSDGRCRFVVLETDHNKELYSWDYQPTFSKDIANDIEKKTEVKETESKYECGFIYYILKKGKVLNYDNFYKDDWDCSACFDVEKDAHKFMREKGYNQNEYNIVYEYSVWPKNEDWVCGVGLGLTKKQAREKLNVNLQYYNLKLLANGEIKEI